MLFMVRMATSTTATMVQTTVATVACYQYSIRDSLAFWLCSPWSQVRIRFRFSELPILKDSESLNDAHYSHLQQKLGTCLLSAFCESAATRARNVPPVLLRSYPSLHEKSYSVAHVG